jgi:Fic family protein
VLFEASQEDEDLTPDVREVSNYIRALEYGWTQISYRPISMGLIREMHSILMDGVRGHHLKPGEFRDDQNYIGTLGDTAATARFVPPPPSFVESLMHDLESYIADSARLSLIRLALIHYQFEVIHPFFDGNGRLGRLLVTLLLGAWNLLDQPMLYISTYLEAHRDEYQQRLSAVSKQDDWHAWISFFLTAIETQAEDGAHRGHTLLKLREDYRNEYQRGKSSGAVLVTIDALFERPSITINEAASLLNLTYSGAKKVVNRLVDDQLLVEATGRTRNRVFIAPDILRAIEI